jgi:hypothetical protein
MVSAADEIRRGREKIPKSQLFYLDACLLLAIFVTFSLDAFEANFAILFRRITTGSDLRDLWGLSGHLGGEGGLLTAVAD